MTTNPDVPQLAREIAAGFCASEYMAHMTLAGGRDTGDAVSVAIAAIERTAQLNADHLDDIRMPTCARAVRSHYALRQPEKGSTDE